MKPQGFLILLYCFLFLFYACQSDKTKIPTLSNEEILRIDDELSPISDSSSIILPEEEKIETDSKSIIIDSTASDNFPKKLDRPNFTAPYISFTDSTLNLVDIEEDSIVKFNFEFINLGRKPLELKSIEPVCGCTVAESTFLPIKSNEKGVIKGSINTKGKKGKLYTTILVHSNAENSPTLLRIQGQVKAKKVVQ